MMTRSNTITNARTSQTPCILTLLSLGYFWVLCLGFGLFSFPTYSDPPPLLSIGEAHVQKLKWTWRESTPEPLSAEENLFARTVKKDLEWTEFFEWIPPASGVSPTPPVKLDFQLSFATETPTSLKAPLQESWVQFRAQVRESLQGTVLLEKTYFGKKTEIPLLGHAFANDILEKITGLPGIFLTRIAMACDLTGKKEIYTMAFDGSDLKQITRHHSLAFAPSWSPEGDRLAYSVYTQKKQIKQIGLYELNFITQTLRLLSQKPGINTGASYAPDGKTLALVLTYRGDSEIFSLDLQTNRLTPLTGGQKFSVEPDWSPDGKQLIFSSSRTGAPMLFTMNRDGSQQKRLTFAGRYNATPSWSPRNNKIAFSGWIEKQFDLFIMNPDGTEIERLTDGKGNHEDPSFSPDGQWIAFSSDRASIPGQKKQRHIYVIGVKGGRPKRLTYGTGQCTFPRWSPWLKNSSF